jgi:predicted DsbA family dithiol-disulfide isomerase
MEKSMNKMTVEIWSDIMCPFCYLGKRRFEEALALFPEKDQVNVVWKSFQLNPGLKTDTSVNINEYLSEAKGVNIERARQMNNQVVMMAKEAGLEYNLDKIVVANTFRAHILLHFALKQGKQNKVKELLLKAYFTRGRNIDDIATLIEIANEAGLETDLLSGSFENEEYSDEVRHDIYEARQLEIHGVPYFVFDRRYGISGAQNKELFLEILEKTFNGWSLRNREVHHEAMAQNSCTTDGDCL